MDFTNFLPNKEEFSQAVKDEMSRRSLEQLEVLKQQMANDFLKQEQE